MPFFRQALHGDERPGGPLPHSHFWYFELQNWQALPGPNLGVEEGVGGFRGCLGPLDFPDVLVLPGTAITMLFR